MQIQISLSASLTNSFRGTTKLVAKKSVKLSDDDHDATIKKGDTFHVKKIGNKFYALDKDGKDVYQFTIDEKRYNQLLEDNKEEVVKETPSKVKSNLQRLKIELEEVVGKLKILDSPENKDDNRNFFKRRELKSKRARLKKEIKALTGDTLTDAQKDAKARRKVAKQINNWTINGHL
jgi:hypothetical protein